VGAQTTASPFSAQKPAAPTATTPAAPGGAAIPPGDVEAGRKIYVSHGCYQCHGFEGQGSVAGPRLGPKPAPYPYFSSYIRKPTLLMPPYTAKVLSDRDVAHIYAYLQARPAPPPVESLELLRQGQFPVFSPDRAARTRRCSPRRRT
jgi:ubiquinol-cytochrome c reductase cytochrome c subunit